MDDDASELIAETATKTNSKKAMEAEIIGTPNESTEKIEVACADDSALAKDSSLEEDLLGAQHLLMSDSEDEGEDCSSVAQNNLTPEKLKKKIPSDDKAAVNNNMDKNAEAAQENTATMSLADGDEDDDELVTLKLQRGRKKIAAIIDSDSDDDGGVSKPLTNMKPKISALIDTDSESGTDEIKTSKEVKRSMSPSTSQDDDKRGVRKSKISSLVDSDTESDSDNNSENDLTLPDESRDIDSEQQTTEKAKPMRVSAKKALDEMQAIQSEQQRLHREAHISIPYHKPKRHSLQEFLKRRTIMKPATESESSPVTAPLLKRNLKMTSEELEEYAKLMEDRAKEATEFFKSESESEEEELKDNCAVIDQQNDQTEVLELFSEYKMQPEEYATTASVEETVRMPMESPMDETNCVENVLSFGITPEFAVVNSQPIVTEVLELPRLDISTLHISETDAAAPSFNSAAKAVNISPCGKNESEDVKKRVLPMDIELYESPTLKGDSNMLIDLDSGELIAKKPTGADNLLQRLLATHRARKAKTTETVSILSHENGKLEMTKVNVNVADDGDANTEHKPGASYFKLKENLKTLMKKKRLEDLQKKQEDENEYNKCLEGDDDYEEDEEEYELEDECKARREKYKPPDLVIDEEENALEISDEEDAAVENIAEQEQFNDDAEIIEENDNEEMEAVEEHEEEAQSAQEDTDEETDDESDSAAEQGKIDAIESKEAFKMTLTNTQRKNRIIKPFAIDSDDDDDIDLLKTQPPIVATNVATPLFGSVKSLLKSSFDLGDSIALDEDDGDCSNTQQLLALCSGKFDATQKNIAMADTVIMSQIPITQRGQSSNAATAAELLELCSGTFEESSSQQQSTLATQSLAAAQQQQESVKPTVFSILSSDEEDSDGGLTAQKRNKKLSKKLKKRQVKLGFSDDEEDSVDCVDAEIIENEGDDDGAVDDDNNIPETYVEYDSEENEIVVELTKNDCIQRAEKFLENEAELSESEWGSADEDEKNMDRYDIELGDEDDFDRAKLQQELGQIHARKMLDEDIREVRKIQEMLFEDEENDGVGRQRQFRWKNAESGFSLDDMNRNANNEGANGESDDEEQQREHLWRKLRFEREQLLKEQGLKENSQELLNTSKLINSPLSMLVLNSTNSVSKSLTPTAGANTKKLHIITAKTPSSVAVKQKASPFLISSNVASTVKTTTITPNTTTILHKKTARSSFLVRDKETLTKFANLTKNLAPGYGEDETAGTVSVKTVKAKNFVFATLTKEEHEHMKRKADDLIGTETGINFMKKPRTNGKSEKQCLIDQLLL